MARGTRKIESDDVLIRTAEFIEETYGSDSWSHLFPEGDRELAPYFLRLMVKLYKNHKQGKVLHKMDACRFIPVKHAISAKKYIDLANEKGWVEFVDDDSDKRKTVVQPSEILLKIVESYVTDSAQKIRTTANDLKQAESGTRPQ
jgi:hypothetical protein